MSAGSEDHDNKFLVSFAHVILKFLDQARAYVPEIEGTLVDHKSEGKNPTFKEFKMGGDGKLYGVPPLTGNLARYVRVFLAFKLDNSATKEYKAKVNCVQLRLFHKPPTSAPTPAPTPAVRIFCCLCFSDIFF